MAGNLIENYIDNILQDKDIYGDSIKWANWMSKLSATTCLVCINQHGKIFDIAELKGRYEIEIHENCQCVFVPMRTKNAGTATDMGYNGADAQLFYNAKLPNYYVKKEDAQAAGWVSKKKNLAKVLPGKMIGGDYYNNESGKLPSKSGRVWYEADINYVSGKRNRQRALYSNDGLIFVTYDHYKTFYEII